MKGKELTAQEMLNLERHNDIRGPKRTCKKSLQVEPINPTVKDLLTVAGLSPYRDMYVALTICAIPQGDEVVVHGLDGSTEYTISAEQCEFLRQEMKRLLEKQKGETK